MDGTVLITGGGTNTAEIYYPNKNKFIGISPMHYKRKGHTATLMNDQMVMVEQLQKLLI
ncbi:MAG: kelch repeat-containing protein [Candidatus Gastranaerophilales bacterium]|nr:kelch repeat-containing protein [Candidatus Gastranaerophilales bacterium]